MIDFIRQIQIGEDGGGCDFDTFTIPEDAERAEAGKIKNQSRQDWERYGKPWGVRITPELERRIRIEAGRLGLSQREFVEWLVRTALNAVIKGQLKPPLKKRALTVVHEIAEFPDLNADAD